MKKMLLLGIAAAALVAAVPARAALTLDGQTGIARVPTADVAAAKTLGAAVDYVFSDDTFMPLRLGFGATDNLEIGAHYWFVDTEGIDGFWGVNVKYRLPFEVTEGFGLAAGAAYQTRSMGVGDDVATLDVYGVASYDLTFEGFAIEPTLGLKWVRRDFGDTEENGFKFFGGVVGKVLRNLSVGAEFITSNEDVDPVNADADVWLGARYMPIEHLTVEGGIINNANIGGGDPTDYTFHLGLQYEFSFAR